jgi:hypothetical protein
MITLEPVEDIPFVYRIVTVCDEHWKYMIYPRYPVLIIVRTVESVSYRGNNNGLYVKNANRFEGMDCVLKKELTSKQQRN